VREKRGAKRRRLGHGVRGGITGRGIMPRQRVKKCISKYARICYKKLTHVSFDKPPKSYLRKSDLQEYVRKMKCFKDYFCEIREMRESEVRRKRLVMLCH
jgi:hypothetical protein